MTSKIVRKPPIRVDVHKHFDNVDEPWRTCFYCGQFTANQPTGVGVATTPIYGGRMYPERELIRYQGQYYCKKHYNWRFNQKFKDDMQIDIQEEDSVE